MATQPTTARQVLNAFLATYGLQDLSDWAWTEYTKAGGGDLGMQVVQAELPNQQAFVARFPAIAARTKAGLPSITPTDYVNYETQLRQSLTQYGVALPTTGAEFNKMVEGLLVHDVSASEAVNRVSTAYGRIAQAPIEVRQAAEQAWGIHGDAALAALYLDPEQSYAKLDQLSQAQEVLGTGAQFGVNLTTEQALGLAAHGADQQLGQFAKLAQINPLFHANQGEDPNLTAERQGVGYAFGTNAEDQLAVTRRMAERQAALAGSGGPTQSNTGLTGLGAGPRT